jgi:hypothetical protein
MDYLPPGYIQQTGDERFPRFIIRDGLGQYWARDRWSDKPADAVLFYRELDAVKVRNCHCLGADEADVYTATIVVTVHARRWSAEELAHHLKRHREFFRKGPAGKEGLLLEIVPDTLKKVDGENWGIFPG